MGDVHAMRDALAVAKEEQRPPMTFIFAGNLAAAHDIARDRGLRKGEWRYLTRLASLVGYQGQDSCLVLIADSWYGRTDGMPGGSPAEMSEILARLRTADLAHEYVAGR